MQSKELLDFLISIRRRDVKNRSSNRSISVNYRN